MKWMIMQALAFNWIISNAFGDIDDDRVTMKTIPEETASGRRFFLLSFRNISKIPSQLKTTKQTRRHTGILEIKNSIRLVASTDHHT